MERTIIYCKSIRDCGQLFQVFKSELGEDSYFPPGCPKTSNNLLFGMYHHNTLDKHKTRVLNSFHEEDGICRIVFATNALGMGVNFPNVRTVINYGPPREIEEFVQEIGRAGRDGKPALALLLYNGRHLKKCEESILEYCSNKTGCLRKMMASEFQQIEDLVFESGSHNCCINCHEQCDCCNECPVPLPSFVTHDKEQEKERNRKVSKEDKELLRDLLMDQLEMEQNGLVTYLNPECTAGFSNSLVQDVLKHCKRIFTLDDIILYLPVLKKAHACIILNMLQDVFEDICEGEIERSLQVDPELFANNHDLTYGVGFESISESEDEESDSMIDDEFSEQSLLDYTDT